MQLLARQTGLVKAIDDKLKLLKRHLSYYESDHVLNIAYIGIDHTREVKVCTLTIINA